MHLMIGLYETIDSKSRQKVAKVNVEGLSDEATLRAGDGCIGHHFSQTIEALFTEDVIAGKLLWLFVDVQTEGTGDLLL